MLPQLKNDALILAAVTDSEQSGLWIFRQTREGRFVHNDMLKTKQMLFFSHPESFYGVAFNVFRKTVQIEGSRQEAEGIWIPAENMHVIASLNDRDLPFSFSGCFNSVKKVHETIADQLNVMTVIPDRDGNWTFSGKLTEMLADAEPYSMKYKDEVMELSFSPPENMKLLFQEWLQYHFLNTGTFKQSYSDYKNALKRRLPHKDIKEWLRTLADTGKSFTISEHLYPACLKEWNGNVPERYQLLLTADEPEHVNGLWELTWHLKDWQSGSQASLKNIYDGDHPFRTNPFPWLKQKMSTLDLSDVNHKLTVSGESNYLPSDEFSQFLASGLPLLEHQGVSVLMPEQLTRKIRPKAKAVMSRLNRPDYKPWAGSSISWRLTVGDKEIREDVFRRLVEEKKELLKLDGQWVMWDRELAQVIAAEMDKYSERKIPVFNVLRNVLEQNEKNGVRSEDTTQSPVEWEAGSHLNDFLNKTVKRVFTRLSPRWQSILKPYQQEGALWMLNMRSAGFGCCLADDMGLGKTIQTISYMDHVFQEYTEASPFLITAPASLVHHWKHEIRKYAPELTVLIHRGGQGQRRARLEKEASRYHVIICSYPVAARDLELLASIEWTGTVCDEAQQLKNSYTKQTSAVKKIAGGHRIALTGTPVENHPSEIWSLFDLLNPGYLKDETWFYEKFLSYGSNDEKTEKLQHLQKYVRPFILRRTKAEFMSEWDLPEKQIHNHDVTLTKEQMVLYEAVYQEWQEKSEAESEFMQKALLFKTMTRMKQICNHPAQFLKEHSADALKAGRSGKWDHALQLLDGWIENGTKGLIFTQYKYMGDIFRAYARSRWKMDIPFFHGGLTLKQREKMIDGFQHHHLSPVMIISLRAGGFGINLTEATEVLHYDRWWNPAVEAQATDRIHRIGQLQQVNVHTMTSKGTIEERINDLIKEKEFLQQAVAGGGPLPLWEMTKKDLDSLFSLH